jgi:hypothetical protein
MADIFRRLIPGINDTADKYSFLSAWKILRNCLAADGVALRTY